MEVWHIWILVGVGFLIWEIFTPGFLVANVGLGCFAAALVSYLEGSLTYQVVAFAVMNLIGFMVIRPLFLKTLYKKGDKTKLGPRALIGRTGMVTEEIIPHSGQGRVKVNGAEWKAVSANVEKIEKGRAIEVTEIESTTLTVTPIKEQA